MRAGFKLISLGLALVLGGSATMPPNVSAQNAAEDTTKRKVKTRVPAEYPPIAKQMHLSGKVKIETTISAEGKVTNARVIGGSPVLASAALKAVYGWRFEPGPKETTEIIEFEFNSPD
jgi:TonB family protein